MLIEYSQVTAAVAPGSTLASPNGITGGAAAGIGFGVGIGVILLCILGIFLLRKRKRSGGEIPIRVQEDTWPSTPELAGNPRNTTAWLNLKSTPKLDNQPRRDMTELAGNAVRPSRVQVNMTELPANASPASGTQLDMTELPENTTLPPGQHMTELSANFGQPPGAVQNMPELLANFGQRSGAQLSMASPEEARPEIPLAPEASNSQSTQQNLPSYPVDNYPDSSTQVLSPQPPDELAILQEQQANIESKRRTLLQLKELEEEEENIKRRIKELRAASANK